MKIEMSERLKHRLTGLVVVISIAIIFLPAMMKKSNRRFEETVHVAVKLPHKPQVASVSVPGKKVLFDSVKVAHVEIPPFPKAPEKIASAEPIKLVAPALASQLAKLEIPPVKLRKKPLVLPSAKISKIISMHLNNDRYGVQLASFSQQINAQQLVNRLRQHGYTANYTPIQGKKGRAIYKVVVGSLAQKEAALILQKKLAANLKLSGFIVKMA